jgi:hypothetical protein
VTDQPQLTYPEPDGTATAGHSGTTTSRDRAVSEAKSGKAVHVQSEVLSVASRCREDGVTIAELRTIYRGIHHHGSLSSALTNLHRTGLLVCLTEKRDRCHVYVRPEYANGRSFRLPVRVAGGKDKAGAQDQPAAPRPQSADLGIAEWVYAAEMTDAYEQGYGLGSDAGWQKGYDEGIDAATKRPGALLTAKHEGVDIGRRQQAQRTMNLITNMREQMKGRGPVEPHTTTCWMKHPRCALDAVAKGQVIP